MQRTHSTLQTRRGTQASKLIPYTTSLKAEFQRGLGAWIADLYAGKPTLMSGRAYWSITPPAAPAAQRRRHSHRL